MDYAKYGIKAIQNSKVHGGWCYVLPAFINKNTDDLVDGMDKNDLIEGIHCATDPKMVRMSKKKLLFQQVKTLLLLL